MKHRFFALLLALLPVGPALMARESDEKLALRRISLLYQEHEYVYAERAVSEFLVQYPESADKEELMIILGHIAFENSDYEKALFYYRKAEMPHLKTCYQRRLWHALYMQGQLKELIAEVKDHAHDNEAACFYLAKALLHEGLEPMPVDTLALERALALFRRLESSSEYVLDTKEAMVTIYRATAQNEKAQEELLALASLLHAKENAIPEMLALRTALELAKHTSQEAERLLTHVMRYGVKKKKEAAALLFSMLARERNLDALVSSESLFRALLAPNQLALFHTLLGKMYYDKQEIDLAIDHLAATLTLPLAAPFDREVLELLVLSIDQTKKEEESAIALLEKSYKIAEHRYGKDPLLTKIELSLARKLTEAMRYQEADAHISRALAQTNSEEATVEKIRLLGAFKRWEEADQIARDAIEKNPSTAIYQAYLAMLSQAAQALPDQAFEKRKIEILRKVVSDELSPFSENEKFESILSLAKSLLGQNQTDEALLYLSEWEKKQVPSELKEELAALLCYAHLKKGHLEEGIRYGETAVSNKDCRSKLALALFNAYISLAQERNEPRFEIEARRHLSYAILANLPVSLHNRLWLFHGEAKRAQLFGDEQKAKAALGLIADLLANREETCLDGHTLIVAASLYGIINESHQGLSLIEYWKQCPNLEKENESLVLAADYVTAKLYLAAQKKQEARDLFTKLQEAPIDEIACGSKLQLARMSPLFSRDKMRATHEETRKTLALLSELKNMRCAQSEPVHLEAALDWIELSTAALAPQERLRKQLFLLNETKKDFQSTDDLVSKDYHELLRANPDQYELFTSYMHYIDGVILQLEAKMAKNENEQKEKKEAADALFGSLVHTASPYLRAHLAHLGHKSKE